MARLRCSLSEPSARSLTLAGTSLIAVSFGLARYGYGLFVPEFRANLHLSTAQIGAFSSVSYAGYGLGLIGCGILIDRRGARATLLLSATLVSVGIFVIASAGTAIALGLGVGVAGIGVGLSWPPFTDLAARHVDPSRRPRVVSTISTGTSFGLIVAVPLAVLAGHAWRAVWLCFGALALITLAVNARILPSAPERGLASRPHPGPKRHRTELGVLAAYAAIYGVLGAVFFTFAVELARSHHHSPTASALLWVIVGITGLAALWAGDGVTAIGLRATKRLICLGMAAGLLCTAIAPSSLITLCTGAAIFGPFYMAGAAIMPSWAQRIDPDTPAGPHTIATAVSALGSVAGAAAAGALGSTSGLPVVFVAATGLALIAAPILNPSGPR